MLSTDKNFTMADVSARTAGWSAESFGPLYQALGLDAADALRVGLLAIAPDAFDAAMQRVARAFQNRPLGGDTDSALVAMARDRDAPPPKTVKELVKAARAWAKQTPREPSTRFLPSVGADIAALPADDREWVSNGLRIIAAGDADDLPPKPAPPPAVNPDAIDGIIRKNREALMTNRERLVRNIREGRGLCDAPEPEAAAAGCKSAQE